MRQGTQGMLSREHVTSQETLKHEYISKQGMSTREYLSTQGKLARNTQDTFARENARYVGT